MHGLDRKLPRLSYVLVVVALSEGAVGLRLPVILFCIYFLKSFRRLLRLSGVRGGRRLEPLLHAVAAEATFVRLWRWHKRELLHPRRVIRMVGDLVGRHRLLLSAHALPIYAFKERVRFKRVVTFHSETFLRFELQKLVNEVLEPLIVHEVWPLELATQDLVEDVHLGAAEEGRLAANHLVQDDAEGPEVREGARLSFVEHLGRHIERSAHKGIRSFCFLDVLQFLLRPRVERRLVIFTVVQRLSVAEVDLYSHKHTHSLLENSNLSP